MDDDILYTNMFTTVTEVPPDKDETIAQRERAAFKKFYEKKYGSPIANAENQQILNVSALPSDDVMTTHAAVDESDVVARRIAKHSMHAGPIITTNQAKKHEDTEKCRGHRFTRQGCSAISIAE